MLWIFFAIFAHVANGLVFIVDKSLLGTKTVVGRPIQYALYSAALAGLAGILIPFAHVQTGAFLVTWALGAGAIHIIALYIFFSAMRTGEPSRVVPITGSAVPLFTILFAFFFLGELFTLQQGLGMLLLIVGGALLSLRITKRTLLHSTSVLLPVLAGILFAAYFAITKYIYAHVAGQFLGIFITTRLVESFLAIVGVVIMSAPTFFARATRKNKKARRASSSVSFSFKKWKVPVIFTSNKLLAAGAFLLQNYAISQGSVSVVNALQGVQYAFVFLLALFVSRYVPKLFTEEVRKDILAQKIAGIALVSIGVALIV